MRKPSEIWSCEKVQLNGTQIENNLGEQREKILRTLLSKEKTDDLDFHELWQMTEGYSGSDLKDLCITGSYRHFRELIQQEILKDKLKGVEDPLLFSLLIRLSTDFDI